MYYITTDFSNSLLKDTRLIGGHNYDDNNLLLCLNTNNDNDNIFLNGKIIFDINDKIGGTYKFTTYGGNYDNYDIKQIFQTFISTVLTENNIYLPERFSSNKQVTLTYNNFTINGLELEKEMNGCKMLDIEGSCTPSYHGECLIDGEPYRIFSRATPGFPFVKLLGIIPAYKELFGFGSFQAGGKNSKRKTHRKHNTSKHRHTKKHNTKRNAKHHKKTMSRRRNSKRN
jgi:hypothetical protein